MGQSFLVASSPLPRGLFHGFLSREVVGQDATEDGLMIFHGEQRTLRLKASTDLHRANAEIFRLKGIRVQAIADEKTARLDRQILKLKTEELRRPRVAAPLPAPPQTASSAISETSVAPAKRVSVKAAARTKPAKPSQPKRRGTVKKGPKP